jgi:hypothetical protein
MGSIYRARCNVHFQTLLRLARNNGLTQIQLIPYNNRRTTSTTSTRTTARATCDRADSFVADNTTSTNGRHANSTITTYHNEAASLVANNRANTNCRHVSSTRASFSCFIIASATAASHAETARSTTTATASADNFTPVTDC